MYVVFIYLFKINRKSQNHAQESGIFYLFIYNYEGCIKISISNAKTIKTENKCCCLVKLKNSDQENTLIYNWNSSASHYRTTLLQITDGLQ